MYTIEDLNAAAAALDEVAARWTAAYSATRPNPLDAEAKAAAETLRAVEDDLESRGLLPYVSHRSIERILDATYPNAQSREVVLHEGKRYRRRFHPASRSSTGKTVKKWTQTWEPLDD